jgi:hypothetical protein
MTTTTITSSTTTENTPTKNTTTTTVHTHETQESFSLPQIGLKTIPLSPWIASIRETTTNQINQFTNFRNSFVTQYNDSIHPINQSLKDFRTSVAATRKESPTTILGGVCLATALLSLPTLRSGKFVLARNVVIAGLVTSWCLWPATTTGATVVVSEKVLGTNSHELRDVGQREVSKPPRILG